MPCGLSAPKWRTARHIILPTHQNQVPLWTKLQSIRRTVRSPLVGRPQYTCANPPETTTPLEQFLNSTADCQRPSGGPSAVQSCEPHQRHRLWTTFNFQRRTVRSPIADCPQSILPNYQRQHRLWTKPNLTGGLSAPPRRTVRDT